MKKIIGCYNKSVILTYVGICISIFGMLNLSNLNIALVCLIEAAVCDMFDGKIARMCKRTEKEKEFGIQIDSLADIISFVIFPSSILCKFCQQQPIVIGIIVVLYVLSGITRLAWFNITTDGNTKYYQGLPVTYTALIIPLLFLILRNLIYFEWIIMVVYVILSFLFVLNFKVKKPSGVMSAVFLIIGELMCALLIFMW